MPFFQGIKSAFNELRTPKQGVPTRDTDGLRAHLAHSALTIAGAPVGIINQPLSDLAPASEFSFEKGLDIACNALELVAMATGPILVPGFTEAVEALRTILRAIQDIQSTRSEYDGLVERACVIVHDIFSGIQTVYNDLSPASRDALKKLFSILKEIQAKAS
ncbi:hypothetical protein AX16_004464 [Volvariella volvacea WC 439]|nr:hypothetical protein AX16_004464 [Volvariella volvacea WC 439]